MKKFVIALAIAATSTMAFAVPHEGHGRGNKAGQMQRFAEKLGLTDAQKQQIADIKKADFEKNKQLYSDFRAKRQELRQLKQSNDPRVADVKAQLESMAPQVKAAKKASHDAFLNVLTADQRAQLEQWRAQRKSRGPRS